MSRAPKSHHRELIELSALFAAAGIADLFTDVLGHRIEGPAVLVALGAVMGAVTFARHLPARRRAAVSARDACAPLPDPLAGSTESSGRLWRVRTIVEDTPGRLAVLAGAFAAVGGNILTLQVHPAADGVVDEFLVSAAPEITPEQVGAVVAAAGGGRVHVEAADITALADVPTRALTLARRLADDPRELSRVLVELLGAAEAEPRSCGDETAETAGTGGGRGGTENLAIEVSGGRCGVIVVSREQVPFTLVEFARAQAMADLASALHAVDAASPA